MICVNKMIYLTNLIDNKMIENKDKRIKMKSK